MLDNKEATLLLRLDPTLAWLSSLRRLPSQSLACPRQQPAIVLPAVRLRCGSRPATQLQLAPSAAVRAGSLLATVCGPDTMTQLQGTNVCRKHVTLRKALSGLHVH